MQNKPSPPPNGLLAGSLFLAVILFGANNTGLKYLVGVWPALALGSVRCLIAGVLLLGLLRWTPFFGSSHVLTPEQKRRLWLGSGSLMALYVVVFNYALKLTPISHVALYLGAAPVWALLWEGRPQKNLLSLQRYGAAALAFSGVLVLVRSALGHGAAELPKELLGLSTGIVWTAFGRQCRALGRDLSGSEITAHTFWRAGVLLLPIGIYQACTQPIPMHWKYVLILLFCISGGAIAPFALWNNALRHWKTSQVYLFNNAIPLSTMTWAYFFLGEPFTETFFTSMILIGTGVLLGQANLQRVFGSRWQPAE